MNEPQTFAATMQAEGWTDAAAISRLMRIAKQLHRLQERYCSDPTYTTRDENRADRLEMEAHALAPVGFTVTVQSDPRGPAVCVMGPSGRGNTWAGTGYAVPQR